MADIVATLRFGPRPLSRPFRLTAGSSVDVTAEFRDETGAGVAVTGVVLAAIQPDGAAYTWTEGTLTETATGVWVRRFTPPAGLIGDWRLSASCTSPQPETAAGYVRLVIAGDLEEGGPPTIVVPGALGSVSAANITDASVLGRTLLTASDVTAARDALAIGDIDASVDAAATSAAAAQAFAAQASGADRAFASRAALLASPAPAADTQAVVRGDATAANNGYYAYAGGSWTKIADIPVLDVPLVTAVGGTANAITGSASKTPVDGQGFYLTPTATNTGVVTLALNAGLARAVIDANGTALQAGMLVTGRQYMLVFNGTNNTYRVLGTTATVAAYNTVTIVGAAGRFLEFRKANADAQATSRFFFDDTGEIYLYSGGDGATATAITFGVLSNGDVRAYRGRILTANNLEVFHPRNLPPANDDAREQLEQITGPWWEGAAAATSVSGTRPYSVSGADLGRHLRVVSTGGWIDFETMPLNSNIVIDAQNACTLYAGYTGATWRIQGGTRLAVTAGSMIWVLKSQTDLIAFVLSGSAVAATPTIPTYDRKIAFVGQSWAVRESQHALRGIQEQLSVLGLNRDVLSVQNASFGASAISRYAPSDVNNYWWDRTANAGAGGPGPNLTASIAAIQAAPASPTLTDIVVIIGLNDLSIMASSGTYPAANTMAGWKSDFLAMLAHMRTQLSLPSLRAWICPLPAQDLGTFSEGAFTAMRRGALDLIAEGTNIYRGADLYDLGRPFADRHFGFIEQARHGARVMRFITNQVNAQSNFLGPKITGFTRLGAAQYQVTIDLGTGAAYQRPPQPDGFAILPGNDPWATPLAVASGGYSWSGNNLLITTSTDDATAGLAYPYGSAVMTSPSRIVRALDPVTSTWMPLQTYHPTA